MTRQQTEEILKKAETMAKERGITTDSLEHSIERWIRIKAKPRVWVVMERIAVNTGYAPEPYAVYDWIIRVDTHVTKRWITGVPQLKLGKGLDLTDRLCKLLRETDISDPLKAFFQIHGEISKWDLTDYYVNGKK